MKALLFLICGLLLPAQEWTQWRGPARDGVATGFRAPAAWPRGLSPQWKTPAGGGYSTPLVTKDAVFVFSRQGDQETSRALDRVSGKVRWQHADAVPFNKNQYAVQMEKGPFSTPILAAGRLYTLGVTGIVTCLDAATGHLVWQNDYSKRIDTTNLFTGSAMSPLFDAGQLIVYIGDDRKGSLLALDQATGKQHWAWDGDGAGYASPVVADIAGVRQIITLTDRRAISVDAQKGALLWSIGFKDQYIENVVTPVVLGNRVIFSGVRKGTFALDVERHGAQWTTRTVWENTDYPMYLSSPILFDGVLYGLTNKRKGQFFAMDAATGKVLWSTPGREGNNASLVRAGEYLFALTDAGALKVIRLNRSKFDLLTEYQVSEAATWPQPVVSGSDLIVKDAEAVALFRLN